MSQQQAFGSSNNPVSTPVSVINGGTGNSGHGETTINPMQSVFGTVDATVVGTTTIFTFPSRFNIISITLQPVDIVGIPDFSATQVSCGDNSPTYDDMIANDAISLPIVFEMRNIIQRSEFNIPTAGSVAAGAPVNFVVSVPVATATVYTLRVYLNGYYF